MDVNKELVEVMESPHFKELDALCERKVKDAIRNGNVGTVKWHDKPVSVIVYCYNPQTLCYEQIPVAADDFRRWFKEITGRTTNW